MNIRRMERIKRRVDLKTFVCYFEEIFVLFNFIAWISCSRDHSLFLLCLGVFLQRTCPFVAGLGDNCATKGGDVVMKEVREKMNDGKDRLTFWL